jgi:hypothetical protein
LVRQAIGGEKILRVWGEGHPADALASGRDATPTLPKSDTGIPHGTEVFGAGYSEFLLITATPTSSSPSGFARNVEERL